MSTRYLYLRRTCPAYREDIRREDVLFYKLTLEPGPTPDRYLASCTSLLHHYFPPTFCSYLTMDNQQKTPLESPYLGKSRKQRTQGLHDVNTFLTPNFLLTLLLAILLSLQGVSKRNSSGEATKILCRAEARWTSVVFTDRGVFFLLDTASYSRHS
jgi:hypothetical protein